MATNISDPLGDGGNNAASRGRQNYHKGYSFEDRVAEAYRLLGYGVQHGRIFSGRQVDIMLDLTHGDLRIRRAIECKAGEVVASDIDNFVAKLRLVRREYPDALGTMVAGLSFTDAVTAHATAEGIQLTLFRELSAQIMDARSYVTELTREIDGNERYKTELFVEPSIGYGSSGDSTKALEVAESWLNDGTWKQFTLLGDVGSGKSFFCRVVARKLALEFLEKPHERPFPVLIDLRNADREFSLEGLVLTHFARHGLDRASFATFDYLLAEGRAILILDGFDEMASKVTPAITTRNFHELTRAVKRNAKVLLTCRTHYFKSRTEEEDVILGTGPDQYTSEVARDLYWDLISRSGFRFAYLRQFSMSEIDTYIERTCGARAKEVKSKINRVYNLAELSHRPLLLEMIVRSIDRLTDTEVNAAELYRIFTDAWVHRDRWRDVLQADQKIQFLMALSRQLWDEETDKIHYSKLQESVGAELAAAINDRQRLAEVEGEIRTATFLTRDDLGQYGFAHSSYAEYFLARYLAERVRSDDFRCLTVRRLSTEVINFFLQILMKHASLESRLVDILSGSYQARLSENALLILYQLRRNLLVQEQGVTGSSVSSVLRVEMPENLQLSGAKLAQVTLEGAVLIGADLSCCDLRQSILRNIDLSESLLNSALLSKADLESAQLRAANAVGAILTEANLNHVDIDRCILDGADISGSVFAPVGHETASLVGVIANGVILSPNLRRSALGLSLGEAGSKNNELERDKILLQIYDRVRRYVLAYRKSFGLSAEDVASEVILFLLARPAQLASLQKFEVGDAIKMAITLTQKVILREIESVDSSAEPSPTRSASVLSYNFID